MFLSCLLKDGKEAKAVMHVVIRGHSRSLKLRHPYCIISKCMKCLGVRARATRWRSGNVGLDQPTRDPVSTGMGDRSGGGFNSGCRKSIPVYNQPPRSTQPGHPSRWSAKADMVAVWVAGKTV